MTDNRPTVSFVKNARDTKPVAAECDMQLIRALYASPEIRDEKDGKAIIGGKFRKGSRRTDDGVERMYFLVGDIDNKNGRVITKSELIKRLKSLGLEYAAHTTWSHTVELGKWRIAILLSRPVTGAEYKALYQALNTLLGGILDHACCNPSHISYMPSCSAERAHLFEAFNGEGLPLDVDNLLAAAPTEGNGKAVEIASPDGLPMRFRKALERDEVLRRRWEGNTERLGNDKSRSVLDMSLGSMLAKRGFEPDEIVEILLRFPHGKGQEAGRQYVEKTVTKIFSGQPSEEDSQDEILRQKTYSLGELLEDAVYLASSDTITLLSNPAIDCSAPHFLRLSSASKINVGEKAVPVASLWLKHNERKTVFSRTFAPGKDVICRDPNGQLAVNTWRPVTHEHVEDSSRRATPFTEHLEFLIPDDTVREQFTLWLAQLIQRPGEMPPWHCLMYTDGIQGLGRNWVAACIGRMIPAHSALHVDITALAGTAHGCGFNGTLAGKLFCCVDELHGSAFAVGGRRMMETLKTTLTAETRLVNPKYGRQSVEFNRLRVLILSNHVDALPLTQQDRRFLVIRNADKPKRPSYYRKLYMLLEDARFIAAVWKHLKGLDLTPLVMGRAPGTAAKDELVDATEPEHMLAIRDALSAYEFDLISTKLLKDRSKVDQAWLIRQTMRSLGAVQYERKVLLTDEKVQTRVWILKNHEHWLGAQPHLVSEYVNRIF